jgi:Ca2+/Na+ antiporter
MRVRPYLGLYQHVTAQCLFIIRYQLTTIWAYSESVIKSVTLQQKTHVEDQLLTVMAVVILLFTAMITWNIYSWLVLILVILMVITLQLKIESNKDE